MGPPLVLNYLRPELDEAKKEIERLRLRLSTADARVVALKWELGEVKDVAKSNATRSAELLADARNKNAQLDKTSSASCVRQECADALVKKDDAATAAAHFASLRIASVEKELHQIKQNYKQNHRSLVEAKSAITNHTLQMRQLKNHASEHTQWEVSERARMLAHTHVLDAKIFQDKAYTNDLLQDISEKTDLINGMSKQLQSYELHMGVRGVTFEDAVDKKTIELNARILALTQRNEMLVEEVAEQQSVISLCSK